MPHLFYPLGAKFEAIKHATSTGIMRHCENNLEQGSRIQESLCRKHIDVLLNTMNEKELVVMEATAEGLKKARETEVSE